MSTAHEIIRAYRLLPTEPFELLIDPEGDNIIVTWPSLPPELSVMTCEDEGEIWGIDFGHHEKVMGYVGAERSAEIERALRAAFANRSAVQVDMNRYEAIVETFPSDGGAAA